MAKMNKEDRNNFQKCIEEILEELNLGGRGTAEPLVSERTEEFFDIKMRRITVSALRSERSLIYLV